MNIKQILTKHKVVNLTLEAEIEEAIRAREQREFERGVEEGRTTQAILEVQGREQFLNELRSKE